MRERGWSGNNTVAGACTFPGMYARTDHLTVNSGGKNSVNSATNLTNLAAPAAMHSLAVEHCIIGHAHLGDSKTLLLGCCALSNPTPEKREPGQWDTIAPGRTDHSNCHSRNESYCPHRRLAHQRRKHMPQL